MTVELDFFPSGYASVAPVAYSAPAVSYSNVYNSPLSYSRLAAPVAAYSSPLAYNGLSPYSVAPLGYSSNIAAAPLAYSNYAGAPLAYSSNLAGAPLAYSSNPLAYSAAPLAYNSPILRSRVIY